MPAGTEIPFKDVPPSKTFGFGMVGFKKNVSLLPMAVFIGLGAAMCVGYSFYALVQKNDVTVNKTKELPPWERIVKGESQKMVSVKQTWDSIDEVEKLKKEMAASK